MLYFAVSGCDSNFFLWIARFWFLIYSKTQTCYTTPYTPVGEAEHHFLITISPKEYLHHVECITSSTGILMQKTLTWSVWYECVCLKIITEMIIWYYFCDMNLPFNFYLNITGDLIFLYCLVDELVWLYDWITIN